MSEPVDVEAVEQLRARVEASTPGTQYGAAVALTSLIHHDIPALLAEVRALRSQLRAQERDFADLKKHSDAIEECWTDDIHRCEAAEARVKVLERESLEWQIKAKCSRCNRQVPLNEAGQHVGPTHVSGCDAWELRAALTKPKPPSVKSSGTAGTTDPAIHALAMPVAGSWCVCGRPWPCAERSTRGPEPPSAESKIGHEYVPCPRRDGDSCHYPSCGQPVSAHASPREGAGK